MFALADIDQAADQVAHHVVEKGIGGEVEQNILAACFNPDFPHILDRRLGLALGGAEGGKVMLAQKELRPLPHCLHIQGLVKPAHLAGKQRGTHRVVEQQVAVTSGYRAETSMEFITHRPRPQYADTVGQQGIDAANPGAVRPGYVGIEMNDLVQRMYASVGAPRRRRPEGFPGDAGKRTLQDILHAAAGKLTLPAAKTAAVILHAERDSQVAPRASSSPSARPAHNNAA